MTVIRRASVADARAIAELHVRSWQWAYRGLLPDSYLDGLDSTLDRRAQVRAEHLASEPAHVHTWVVEEDGLIVGFASTEPSRDEDAGDETGEVYAIYLAREAAGKGIGRAFFAHTVQDLAQHSFAEATLWVLGTNRRARHFYEAAGWTADGATKVEERPGAILREVRYRYRLEPLA